MAGDDSEEPAAKATGVKQLRRHDVEESGGSTGVKQLRRHGVEESGGSQSRHQGVQTSSSSSSGPTPSQVRMPGD